MQGGKNGHAFKHNYDDLCCKAPSIPRRLHSRNAEELEYRINRSALQTLFLELDGTTYRFYERDNA